MARTIAQIKTEMTTAFMADATIAAKYGFAVGSSWDAYSSKVSIENFLFFIVASSIWVLETLFDSHVVEVNTILETQRPHRPKWYRDKTLAFQFGDSLLTDTDVYAVADPTKQIVQYASCLEYHGWVYIKVAKGNSSNKQPLSSTEQTALKAYLADIKDAGVVIVVVNLPADHYSLNMDIFYDPMVLDANGLRLDTGEATVVNVVKDFIQNQIPFNGEYRNETLVDVLQALDGVVIPELRLARTISNANFVAAGTGTIPWQNIAAKSLPDSGYYKIYNDADLQLNFIAYQTTQSV